MDMRKRAELLAAALDKENLEPALLAAAGLGPLLDTACRVRQARHPQLSPAALAAGLVRVRQGLAARRTNQTRGWAGRPAWAALGLSLVLVVVLALTTAGTVLAAESSLPGQALYPVKRSAEAVQMALTWDPVARSSLLIALADRRLAEVQALCSGDCPAWLLEELAEQSEAAEAAVEQMPASRQADLLEKMVLLTARQQEVLAGVLERAPATARPGLERALERSRHGHERARQALEKGKGNKGEKKDAPPSPVHPLKPTRRLPGPAQGTPARGPRQP